MPRRGHRVMKGGYKGPPAPSTASATTNTTTNRDATSGDVAAAASASSISQERDAPPGEAQGEQKAKEQGERGGNGRDGAKKPPLTHFLCIPLVTAQSRPQLERSVEAFRRGVLGEGEGEGEKEPKDQTQKQAERQEGENRRKGEGEEADEDAAPSPSPPVQAPFPPAALRPIRTLHLTLGVMSLRDSAALSRALSLLQTLDLSSLLSQAQAQAQTKSPSASPSPSPPSATPTPLTLSLRSLHAMHKPHSTSVLYASPHDPTSRLYTFASAVRSIFNNAGLLVPDDRPLRLHATVVNTVYARGGRGKAPGKRLKNGRFDARELMQAYEEFVWAEDVEVEKVAVCEMGARDLGEGRGVGYKEVGCVGFTGEGGSEGEGESASEGGEG